MTVYYKETEIFKLFMVLFYFLLPIYNGENIVLGSIFGNWILNGIAYFEWLLSLYVCIHEFSSKFINFFIGEPTLNLKFLSNFKHLKRIYAKESYLWVAEK